jgi:hypothetical protein
MATKTHEKNVPISPEKDVTLGSLPTKSHETPATSHKPEGELSCYGVYRVKNSAAAGGLWVIRKIVTDGDKIVSYEDSEPDVLEIQMGKIDRFLESATERV